MPLHYAIHSDDIGHDFLTVTIEDMPPLRFEVQELLRDKEHLESLYDPINVYVSQLPYETQREVYNVFHKVVSKGYRDQIDDVAIVQRLEIKIAQVVDLLDYDHFKVWMHQNEDRVIYPSDLLTSYSYDQTLNTTQEKTYIRSEYTGLLALVTFVRALAPLYTDFFHHIRNHTSHHYYKLWMLFVRSSLVGSVDAQKMRDYIEHNQKKTAKTGSGRAESLILVEGLSEDDLTDTLLATVIFQKLLPINFEKRACKAISYAYQTIVHKNDYAGGNSPIIRAKKDESASNKEDASYFEDYRKTSDIPIGSIVELQDSVSSIEELVTAMGFTDFDYARYALETQDLSPYMQTKLDKTQVILLGWFLGKVVNPRTLYYLEYRKLVELMLFAKVALLQHERYYMAALISAKKSADPAYLSSVIRNSLSKHLIKRLRDHYPWVMEEEGTSVIQKTLLEISKDITNNTWQVVGDPTHIPHIRVLNGYLESPQNITDLLMDYVDFVNL